uniref:Si:ch73-91k6.2 n=1 Tax=Callorhinchus milii TaxID=7868 RepID=A0A4W3GSQ7_CALMI|eukprot:gi/632950061/ref/XP_007890513.1/ PREDICTED: alpha-1,6-mannosyl-glycoprotein 2-beta-N-acetylglucosaminyltransferase-like [Callorhinchus milii]
MKFRVYKRKILILALVVCLLLLLIWNRLHWDTREVNTRFDAALMVEEKESGTPKSSQELESLPYNNPLELRNAVYQNNLQLTVLNREKFHQQPELVLVVQVQGGTSNLRILIESLQQSPDIDRVLLIFSLEQLSHDITHLIQRVDFCQVLQIFFPYSLQLYPLEFPGQDPQDCPRDISKEEALKRRCKNADYPDSFGHYREAQFTQSKHHWAWKLHFVWDHVLVNTNYTGPVFFIEENNFLLPDFYHLSKLMTDLQKQKYPDCHILSLGSHEPAELDSDVARKVDIMGWTATKHKMGIGLSREVYNSIMQCLSAFCTYDDYNWDWTVQHISAQCLSRPLKVMVPRLARIYNIMDCGAKQCDLGTKEKNMRRVLESARRSLFPTSLSIGLSQIAVPQRPHTKNGGWGDVRDHSLCQSYSKL